MTLRQRQLAICGAISVLIVAVGWFALIAPQRTDAATAAAKADAAQLALDTLTQNSGTSHGPTKQPTIHTSDLYALDTALPAQADLPSLLFEIQHVADVSGVSVAGISPQPGQASPTGYTVVPINLSLDGSYYNITRFVHNLRVLVSERKGHVSAQGPLFSVTSVVFTTGDGTTKSTPATVGIAAYYYGVVDGAAPPVSTTDTTATTTTTSGS